MISTERRVAAIVALAAIAETIRDLTAASPLGGVPSGELYTHLMDKLDIQSYTALISSLKAAGLVEERAHLLVWIGPAKGGR
jgi:hypothetical protein